MSVVGRIEGTRQDDGCILVGCSPLGWFGPRIRYNVGTQNWPDERHGAEQEARAGSGGHSPLPKIATTIAPAHRFETVKEGRICN